MPRSEQCYAPAQCPAAGDVCSRRLRGRLRVALAAALGHAIPVLDAERAGRLLGQGVAVALAVRGADEGGDDLEVPLGDVGRLAPEVGEAEVDVELEQIDAGGFA